MTLVSHPRNAMHTVSEMKTRTRSSGALLVSASAATLMAGCGSPSATAANCYGLLHVHSCTSTMGADGKHQIPVVTPIYSDER